MAFDFKKEMNELYQPKAKPQLVNVPAARYAAVRGKGDPNTPDGDYQRAIPMLYAAAYAVKNLSKSGEIAGGYDFTVPPLEGFWQQEGSAGADLTKKENFSWISVIRLPDFVTKQDFERAVQTAERKKKISLAQVELLQIDEGLCVQIMHTGSFDSEAESVAAMESFIAANGYENDLSESRLHHEIYLSDPRKTPEEKRRTVLRHPIRKLSPKGGAKGA